MEDKKHKTSVFGLVVAFAMGLYFLYKGLSYTNIGDEFVTLGILESICGATLIAIPIIQFIKRIRNKTE